MEETPFENLGRKQKMLGDQSYSVKARPRRTEEREGQSVEALGSPSAKVPTRGIYCLPDRRRGLHAGGRALAMVSSVVRCLQGALSTPQAVLPPCHQYLPLDSRVGESSPLLSCVRSLLTLFPVS